MTTWKILGIPVTLDFSPPPMMEGEAEPLVEEIEIIDSTIHAFEGYHKKLIEERRADLFQRLDNAGMVDHSDEASSAEDDYEEVDEEEPDQEPQPGGKFLWGLLG